MDRMEYDTKEGIERALLANGGVPTREALHALVAARAAAARARLGTDDYLDLFYVLGRFCLGKSGGVSPGWIDLTPDMAKNAPLVMTQEEYETYGTGRPHLPEYGEPPRSWGYWLEFLPPDASCHLCGGGWTFADCHLFMAVDDEDEERLTVRFLHPACYDASERVREATERAAAVDVHA